MLVQPFANQAQCATGHSKAEMVVKVACQFSLVLSLNSFVSKSVVCELILVARSVNQ